MKPELLLSFFILCFALPTIISTQFHSTDFRQSVSRILSQKIIDQETKKVEKIIKHKTYFQSYHFLLKPNEKSIEFYLDPWAEQQIEGYISIMWKQKNAFLLGNILQSQKLRLQIYQNKRRILSKSFYTKVGFRFYAKQNKIYRMRISHKNQSPFVSKLVTFHVEYFFELFQQQENVKDEVQLVSDKRGRLRQSSNSNNKRQSLLGEKDSDGFENDGNQFEKEEWIGVKNYDGNEQFELWMVSQRLKQFLYSIKILINQAQTKHIAQHSIQKFIEETIDIYWQYELFQCGLVILCTVVEILMVNRLLNANKILV